MDRMSLQEYFKTKCSSGAALAFSGGVDSAFLLSELIKSGIPYCAYYVKTDFQPQFEYEDALRLAKELNSNIKVLELDVLKNPKIAENPSNRCYFCKISIMTEIKAACKEEGFTILMDGTNASDDISDRPGFKALQELEVLSPLRDCGLTKSEIRKLSKEAGLFTWNKPAYSCLATRINTGCRLTKENLRQVEDTEKILFNFGFNDFRIRQKDNGLGIIQITENQMDEMKRRWNEIEKALSPWYSKLSLETRVSK